MTDRYKAAATMVRVENLGHHAEVFIEEAEGGIRHFYIAPDGSALAMFESLEDFMNWRTANIAHALG